VRPSTAELDRTLLDRRALSQVGDTVNVNGTGKISVDVRAPRGTKVEAEAGGLFKKTEIQRNVQMEPASQGPEE
jgi:hypothetical protein